MAKTDVGAYAKRRLSRAHVKPQRNLEPAKAGFSLAASVVAHVGGILAVGFVALTFSHRDPRSVESRTAPPEDVVTIELPTFADGTSAADHEVIEEGATPEAHGGATIARADTGRAGRGGQVAGARAINLAASDEAMRLSPDAFSHLTRDQYQRLRTANHRTTHEDRRATTHPMELTFLASGADDRPERRPVSASDPNRGSLVSPSPSVLGGRPGVAVVDDEAAGEGRGASVGASQSGQLAASPGMGVRNGAPGDKHFVGARIAYARPDVVEAPVTVPAALRARPNDTTDSDQEVSATVRSLVHASVTGGLYGEGRGGSAGPESDPGVGGASGAGSVSRTMGAGDGDVFDWMTSDPLLMPYFRKIHAKVNPLWRDAFPKSAMIELKQGTVILEFSIASNGAATVKWPPVRPSGIDEFDRNCADAIRKASPFEPIPASLRAQGRSVLHIRAPFVAKNPVIQ